jgi:hypothetical protein
MNILEFDHTEHEEMLDLIDQEQMEDFKRHIESSFHSLLFLGKNLNNSKEGGLIDAAVFNIQLLFVYYKRTENYERLSQLKELAALLSDDSKTIVDKEVIEIIDINLN